MLVLCNTLVQLKPLQLNWEPEWHALQVTASFKALAQVHPDLSMSFVSDVAKKMGLPCKDTDHQELDSEHAVAEDSQASLPEYMVSSPNNCSTNMDIDSMRRQQ